MLGQRYTTPMVTVECPVTSLHHIASLQSAMVDDIKPHIIRITKTWANNDITDAELGLEGYAMFRKDRMGRRGGGVLLYIKENIPAYEVQLQEEANIKGGQIEVFKILNGYENIDSNIFFEIKESKITRGHNYTLLKKQSRLDVIKYFFPQRTINVWNNLSTDCVQASSVNMFKNKIYKYLVKAGYT